MEQRVITPDSMPIPKTGHVGYVHIENPYDYATLNPTWTDVDMDVISAGTFTIRRKPDGGTLFTFDLNL